MITAREEQILDGMERGLGPTAIAAELGLSVSYVSSVVTRLTVSGSSDRAWSNMVRMGSEALLAAIRRRHPEARP